MLSKSGQQVSSALAAAVAPDADDTGAGDGWGIDADLALDGEETEETKRESDAEDGSGWDVGDEDLELPEEIVSQSTGNTVDDGYFVPPTKGVSQTFVWTSNSQLAADHVTAGSFETAFKLLHDQVIYICFLTFFFLTKYFKRWGLLTSNHTARCS